MNATDISGIAGVGMILVAYCCNIFRYIKKDGVLFFGLNMAGAGLACFASWMIPFWPFVILEGTWCIVSVIGFIRAMKNS